MKELIKYANEMMVKHVPNADEIRDLLNLCFDEIEQGASEVHEIELCMEDIRQLCGNSETSALLERLKSY
jgi:hypothetical protein